MADTDSQRLPDDQQLAALVLRARDELRVIDPLRFLLMGEGPAGLPAAGAASHHADRARLLALQRELDDVGAPAVAEDRIDLMALRCGLGRAIPGPGPRDPFGAVVLERFLMGHLVGWHRDPERTAAALSQVVEQGPRFLAESREGCQGGSPYAGEVALAAAKRLPALLDAVARAAGALPLDRAMRERLEAGLGLLLDAAAEDSGWILKAYMPETGTPATTPATAGSFEDLGFGAGLDELEAEAEKLLAEQASLHVEAGSSPPEASPGAGSERERRWDAAAVADRWAAIDSELGGWCELPPGAGVEVEPAPSWLGPLVLPLALADPGPLSSQPLRLMVGPALTASAEDLTGTLRAIWAQQYAPAAWQCRGGRLARLLLPSRDVVEGWAAFARGSAPGLAGWQPAEFRRELSWRAMLALVAAGLTRGRLDVEQGASLIAAETGMDTDTARLQAVHVAGHPLAAFSFIAGHTAISGVGAQALIAGDPSSRARLVAAGPIPAAALAGLGITA